MKTQNFKQVLSLFLVMLMAFQTMPTIVLADYHLYYGQAPYTNGSQNASETNTEQEIYEDNSFALH